MKITFASAIAITSLVLLPGCFTGIESTPKITADDVKKQNVVISPEQQFFADVGAIPFSQWRTGKRFYVTDDKIALAFGASAHGVDGLKGQILTYAGVDSLPDVAGNNATILYFDTDRGDRLRYRIDSPLSAVMSRASVDIPFAIDLDVVAWAHELLAAKKLFILTSAWYGVDGDAVEGRKFVPVIIDRVIPGNSVYPLMVCFTDGSGAKGAVYMSLGASRQATRNFDTLFSFSDPHLNYPNISDESWANIMSGRVALEMTRDECRLALGAPKEIERRPGYSGVMERWIYTDGAYLVFEDGILSDFRR